MLVSEKHVTSVDGALQPQVQQLLPQQQVQNHIIANKLKNDIASNNNSTEIDSATTTNNKDLATKTTTNSSPYNTLSLGRKGKRGISQLGCENNVEMRNSSLATTSGSNNNNNNDPAEQNKNFSGNFVVESAEYTLILPDINAQPPDFRDFLKKDLIETSTLFSLELAGRLNWWVDLGVCRRLFPLVTIGDGNCLLHAASLALFGVHDNRLVLRQALSKMMCQSSLKDAFFRRWRWHQTIINKQSELVYTEDEWMTEWLNLGKLASTQPRVPSLPPNQQPHLNDQSLFFNNNNSNNVDNVNYNLMRQMPGEDSEESDEILYESLEELHVFVLAHVLKRTIIIIADTILKNLNGEPLAPISFGGIYLPLELPPEECHRSPLLLTYDAAHFSALVPMENTTEIVCLADAVPLVDPDFELLPVHFAYDPGPDYQWSFLDDNFNSCLLDDNKQKLLKTLPSYLDIKFVSVPYNGEFELSESAAVDANANNTNSPDTAKTGTNITTPSTATKLSSLNRSNDSGVAMNSSVSNGGNNSSRAGSSESSNDDVNNCQSKTSDSAKSNNLKEENQNNGATKRSNSSISRNKKFSSFKKRLSRTFRMGFCASGIQQDLDEIEEHHEKKKFDSLDGEKINKDILRSCAADDAPDDSDKSSHKKSPSSSSLQKTSHSISNSSSISNSNKLPKADGDVREVIIDKQPSSPQKQQNQTNVITSSTTTPTNTPATSTVAAAVAAAMTSTTTITVTAAATTATTSATFTKSPSLTELKCSDKILCARLYHKRDDVQDRILNRYLLVARERFKMEDSRRDSIQNNCSNMVCHLNPHQTSAGNMPPLQNNSHPYHALMMNGCHDALIQCINAGCEGVDASAETSYLCRECFVRQKQEEMNLTLKINSSQRQQQQQRMQQQQQQQQQYHYMNQQYPYSKFPSSSSTSTIQLPLLKNSTHLGPLNPKHTTQSYHATQFSLPTNHHNYSTTHHLKPSCTTSQQSISSTSTGLPRANMISSTVGAAAFNKSFESGSHLKEETSLTKPSYNVLQSPPAYKSAVSGRLVNNDNNNNNNIDKRYMAKDVSRRATNTLESSTISNNKKLHELNNMYPNPHFHQMQQLQQQQQQQYNKQQQQSQNCVSFQPIDSNRHAMYASEEDDDENDDDLTLDDYDDDDEEDDDDNVDEGIVRNIANSSNNSHKMNSSIVDRQQNRVEACNRNKLATTCDNVAATNCSRPNNGEHSLSKLNIELKRDSSSSNTKPSTITTTMNNNSNIQTLNVNYRSTLHDSKQRTSSSSSARCSVTAPTTATNNNNLTTHPQQQPQQKLTTTTNATGPWATKFHVDGNPYYGYSSSSSKVGRGFTRNVADKSSSDFLADVKNTKSNYIAPTSNYVGSAIHKESYKKH